MRRAAWIVCWMLAVPAVGVGQPQVAPEPKSEVPPSYRLGVLRLTLDGMVVVRQQVASYRYRQTPTSYGKGSAYYYEPYCYDVDRVVKLADLSIKCADGSAVDEAMLRKRLTEPTVAVMAMSSAFNADHYRHCKPETLVVLGTAVLPPAPEYYFAPAAPPALTNHQPQEPAGHGPVPYPPAATPPVATPPVATPPVATPPVATPAVAVLPVAVPPVDVRPIKIPPAPTFPAPVKKAVTPPTPPAGDAGAKFEVRVQGPADAAVNETKRYQVTVLNRGDRPLHFVGVTLSLDQGLEIVKTSEELHSVPGAPPVWPALPIVELPPGGSRTLNVDVRGNVVGRLVFSAGASGYFDSKGDSPTYSPSSNCSTQFRQLETVEPPGLPPAQTAVPRIVPVPQLTPSPVPGKD